MNQNEVTAPVRAEQVKVEVPGPETRIKLTKGEKFAVGACIGGAALAVVEAGVIVFLINRNGGVKAAFSKKDADDDDFEDDEFVSYEEFDDEETEDKEFEECSKDNEREKK